MPASTSLFTPCGIAFCLFGSEAAGLEGVGNSDVCGWEVRCVMGGTWVSVLVRDSGTICADDRGPADSTLGVSAPVGW
ncbi:hypothetical protein BDP55DRAFT_302257 [Colletotrichum godetiae]|uniref:Secreted protein n=1 Tax=Colletotrichum godetiae TaxID=1209918 RepID=A0AAJ0AW33_9PEZI|nr:uncharacterized protein BDP55DRAFT_302257 [Colletotrichum godetiae]KAK1690662.1 hypothetical protein BDP55DRAFT_302257 [Colletotrichum godetiae]